MIPRTARSTFTLLALSLAACGQKGPLYMPDNSQGEVVTRPASDAATATSGGASNSPASPAPEVSAPATDEDPKKKDKSNGTQPPPK